MWTEIKLPSMTVLERNLQEPQGVEIWTGGMGAGEELKVLNQAAHKSSIDKILRVI